MNNILKYRKLIINALLVLGIVCFMFLMKANKNAFADEPSKAKTNTESVSAFEMLTLKFI